MLSQFTQAISTAMSRLARGLAGLEQFDVLNYDDLLSSVQAAARHLEEVHRQLELVLGQPAGQHDLLGAGRAGRHAHLDPRRAAATWARCSKNTCGGERNP